jgi:hypothetical protein
MENGFLIAGDRLAIRGRHQICFILFLQKVTPAPQRRLMRRRRCPARH